MADYAEEEIVENPTLRAAYNLAPLHQNQPLRWDYEVDLIGEKIYDYDKVIHLCQVCELPILVYGRMLPCKHIFCFDCARKCDKSCRRCNAKVQKVEKSALGTVFVCTHGAPKHSTNGCRRTYLSQRDLQSHISHRHLPKSSSSSSKAPAVTASSIQPAPNQLPLTQQQAAQQAAQKTGVTPAHLSPSHPQSSVLPGLGLLGQAVSSHAPVTSLQGVTQQSSPVTPLIPGLGDIRPVSSAAQPIMGHGSPLLPPGPSPNPMSQPGGNTIQQGMGSVMSQEMGNSMSQGMGSSMSPGMRGVMSQGMGNTSHGMGNMMTQGMGNAIPSGMGNAMSPGMGSGGYPQGMNPMSQGVNSLSPGMNSSLSPGMGGSLPQGLGLPYSAGGSNPDIYRPLDMPSMGQQHPPPQQQPQQAMGMGSPHLQQGQTMQPYGHSSQFPVSTAMLQPLNSQQMISTMAGHMHPSPLPHQHSQMPVSQPLDNFNKSQSMSSSVPTSQSRTNVNLITVPIQDEGQYRPIPYVNPAMASQNNNPNFPPPRPNVAAQPQSFSQPPLTSSSTFSPMGSQPQNLTGTNSSSSMPFNQVSGIRTSSPSMMVNPRPGLTGNIHPNMPQALAGVMQAAMNIARAQGGAGLMPTPGSVAQGVGNRFPAGRWSSPRVIQPRMTQGQQRPRTESQFNQGPYYS